MRANRVTMHGAARSPTSGHQRETFTGFAANSVLSNRGAGLRRIVRPGWPGLVKPNCTDASQDELHLVHDLDGHVAEVTVGALHCGVVLLGVRVDPLRTG